MDEAEEKTEWTVVFSKKVLKQRDELPQPILDKFYFLQRELTIRGPLLSDWPHFGKIVGSKDHYHCHLNRGHPTYVVVWQVVNNTLRVLGIKFIGTHEKVDYAKFK